MSKTGFIEDDAERYEHMLTQIGLAPDRMSAEGVEIRHLPGGSVVVEWTEFLRTFDGFRVFGDDGAPRVRRRTTITHEVIQ